MLGVLFKDDNNKRTKLPLFVLVFILAIFLGTQLSLNQQTILFLNDLSTVFLVAALFCVGTQINPNSLKEIDLKTIVTASMLWLFALTTSFFLINWLQ